MKPSNTFLIGLTGSMGMGKSTTAKMFKDQGIPVWDADAAVHRMYAQGGAAIQSIQQLHPAAIVDGAVSRTVLKKWISQDTGALAKIEAVVHPLLQQDRASFLEQLQTDIAVLDFPLLFETGAEKNVDLIVVVSVPSEIQIQRILARKTMDKPTLDRILAAQMPDSQKRAKADVVIETVNLEDTKKMVQALLLKIREGFFDA